MRHHHRTALLSIALLVAGAVASAEDRPVKVKLTSGEVVEGTLVGTKDHVLTVKTGETTRDLRDDQIGRIDFIDPSAQKDSGAEIDISVEEVDLRDVVAAIGPRAGANIVVDS